MFVFNRLFLLLGLIAAIVIPFLELSFSSGVSCNIVSSGSFIFDNLLDPLFKWLEGLFQIDFDAMAKTMMPPWLYDFFSDSKGEKLAAKMFKDKLMIDDAGFNSILFWRHVCALDIFF